MKRGNKGSKKLPMKVFNKLQKRPRKEPKVSRSYLFIQFVPPIPLKTQIKGIVESSIELKGLKS
jgi:hypothetical protein